MSKLGQRMWRVGRGQEPWKRRETGGVNDNERHLHHSSVLSPTVELQKDKNDSGSPSRTAAAHKTQIKVLAWSSRLPLSSLLLLSFRSSSVGLETGEWCRCRSLSFTPPASLRSHGSRPRPTRHSTLQAFCPVVHAVCPKVYNENYFLIVYIFEWKIICSKAIWIKHSTKLRQ